MTLRRALLATFSGLILAIVLLIVFWDWNWFKGPLEHQLSAATGLDVKVNGPLKVGLGRVTDVVVSQIEATNPGFQGAAQDKDRPVGKIDEVEVKIDALDLLGGRINLPYVGVTKPDLFLTRSADGKSNWVNPDAPATKQDAKRGDFPLLGELKIVDGRIAYRDPGKKLEVDARIATVSGQGGGDKDGVGFSLDGKGTLQKQGMTLTAKGGPLLDLRNSDKPYPIIFNFESADTKIHLDGQVTDPTKLTALDGRLSIEGPSLDALFPVLGIAAPNTPPYKIAGELLHSTGKWEYKNFAGTIGGSDIGGVLEVDQGPNKDDRPFIKGQLVSKKLDFKDIGTLIGLPPPAATAKTGAMSAQQKADKAAYEASDRILPDAKLQLDRVRAMDADVTYKAQSILAPDLPIDEVDLHVKLDHGVLSLSPLNFAVAGGQIQSDIKIDARQPVVSTDYDVRLRQFELNSFFAKAGFPNGGSGKINGRIKLHADGNSIRESLGKSNGSIGAVIDNGTLSGLLASAAGLDIAGAVGFLIKDEQTPLRCLVTDFQVDNGKMTPRIFVLDTGVTTVTGSGGIDLSTEKLNLEIKGEPKQVTLAVSTTPISVGGSFKHPAIGIDPKPAAARVAGAVALSVIATPLAAALAFLDVGDAEDQDCRGLVNQAKVDSQKTPVQAKTAPAPRKAQGKR